MSVRQVLVVVANAGTVVRRWRCVRLRHGEVFALARLSRDRRWRATEKYGEMGKWGKCPISPFLPISPFPHASTFPHFPTFSTSVVVVVAVVCRWRSCSGGAWSRPPWQASVATVAAWEVRDQRPSGRASTATTERASVVCSSVVVHRRWLLLLLQLRLPLLLDGGCCCHETIASISSTVCVWVGLAAATRGGASVESGVGARRAVSYINTHTHTHRQTHNSM